MPDCDAVLNLEVGEDALQYAHRAGRTGRLGGAHGVVISILPLHQVNLLKRVCRRLNVDVQVWRGGVRCVCVGGGGWCVRVAVWGCGVG